MHRLAQHRVEYRSEVAGRATDDLKNLRGRRLLLQRLREVACAGLHFLEQVDIADGDHGLVSKSLHQLNLPILERANVEPKKVDDAECLTFARKRDAEGCLEAHELLCLRPFVVRISKQIGYVYDVTFGSCLP